MVTEPTRNRRAGVGSLRRRLPGRRTPVCGWRERRRCAATAPRLAAPGEREHRSPAPAGPTLSPRRGAAVRPRRARLRDGDSRPHPRRHLGSASGRPAERRCRAGGGGADRAPRGDLYRWVVRLLRSASLHRRGVLLAVRPAAASAGLTSRNRRAVAARTARSAAIRPGHPPPSHSGHPGISQTARSHSHGSESRTAA